MLEKTLDRALVIEDEHYLVEAVSALAPELSGNLLQRSLHTIHEINKDQLRVSALVALIPQLEGDESARLCRRFWIQYQCFRSNCESH